MLTSAPWLTANNPLQYLREGAQIGLESRSQDALAKERALQSQEAGNRLRLSYDTLANQQENQRRQAQQEAAQTAATYALKQSQLDAMSQYRSQQIEEQKARLKQASDRATSAADALKAAHNDTAGFVSDSKDLGAAAAYSKHPNADKIVVNHIMSLEQANQNKTAPTKKGAIDFPSPGQDDAGNAASLIRFTGVPLDDPVINQVLGTNAPPGTGTNYVSRLGAAPAPVVKKGKTSVPQQAIKFLQQNPATSAAFDAKYGVGASGQYLP